jgi:hypothetical protein
MALVSKDELSSRVRQGGIVDENPQPVTRLRLTAQIAMSVPAPAQSTQAAGSPQPPHAPAKVIGFAFNTGPPSVASTAA